MTRIQTPGGPPQPPSSPAEASAGRAGQKRNTEEERGFERMLEEKAGGQAAKAKPSTKEKSSTSPASTERRRSQPEVGPAARQSEEPPSTAGDAAGRVERRDPGDERGSRDDRESGGERRDEGRQSVSIGDLQARMANWTPPPIEVAHAAPTAPRSDAAARIERIAEQIVDAVEVRMGSAGEAEVRLDLSLGDLGAMRVDLARDAEGNLNIRFDAASETTRDLVQQNVADLARRLEIRGVPIETIRVRSADHSESLWQQSRDSREQHQQRDRREDVDED